METRRQRNERRKRKKRKIITYVLIFIIAVAVVVGAKNRDYILSIKDSLFDNKEDVKEKADKKEENIINFEDAAVKEADDNFDYVGTISKAVDGKNIYSYGNYTIKESEAE